MSDIVIKAENLGKKYIIGHQTDRGRYTALRDVWAQSARGLWHKTKSLARGKPANAEEQEEFWALKELNFEIKRGETVGIIGRNGAGKSTLLKVLSRITEPSTGRVTIKGRVASLLEVGTGFHPELSGRENIYLNGAILGMPRAEIRRKFDEIVAFAETEKFLDTPVKRYSSGMYVRLAFAVAAHLEPEILIVDEVLAVGDASFQKKCLGKMDDVAKHGRTVIFVSHNMQAIRQLCSRGILLTNGMSTFDGPILNTVLTYNEQIRKSSFDENTLVNNETHRRGNGSARFTSIKILNIHGIETHIFEPGENIKFILDYKINTTVKNLSIAVGLKSGPANELITNVRHVVSLEPLNNNHIGQIVIELPNIKLRTKEYSLYFWLGSSDAKAYDVVDDILSPITIVNKTSTIQIEEPGYIDIEYNIDF